jgi:two-component system, NtrC family, sensor kinase
MDADQLFHRYRDLQDYIGWTEEDAHRVGNLAPIAKAHFKDLIDDFYSAIQRNPATMKVITGGAQQIERLKGTLIRWLEDLFSGRYDKDYVVRRWKVGLRHVEIGLDQVYTNAALSRLRYGLAAVLAQDGCESRAAQNSLNKLLDLDLAIIEDSYQAEESRQLLEAERQRALRNERLAAIGETMTALVHESRNALQRSKACLEMLSLEVQDRSKAVDLVGRVQRAQEDLQKLFEEVREYAAPLNLKMARCELDTIARQAWQELSHDHAQKRLRLVESRAAEKMTVSGDRFALTQVLRNILENAIQASPPNATISIDYKTASNDGRQEAAIRISDEGPGIAAEHREKVLEAFFTTKSKGTGLGLAIAQRIVECHGGRIEVGDPPKGTEIDIYLPQTSHG